MLGEGQGGGMLGEGKGGGVLSIRDAFWDLEVPDIAGKPPLGTCGPPYGRD
jgi:hypothetical protein